MAKVYLKPYSEYEISGRDFVTVRSTNMRRIVFTPDYAHSIHVTELSDGCLGIFNETRTPFEFTVSRERKVIAYVKYNGAESAIRINSNYRLTQTGVENQEIHQNPDLVKSPILNIDMVNFDGLGRFNLKVEESGYAACVFTERDLLFVRMNGHHSVPRLLTFIENRLERLVASPDIANWISPEIKDMIFRQLFRTWFETEFLGLN